MSLTCLWVKLTKWVYVCALSFPFVLNLNYYNDANILFPFTARWFVNTDLPLLFYTQRWRPCWSKLCKNRFLSQMHLLSNPLHTKEGLNSRFYGCIIPFLHAKFPPRYRFIAQVAPLTPKHRPKRISSLEYHSNILNATKPSRKVRTWITVSKDDNKVCTSKITVGQIMPEYTSSIQTAGVTRQNLWKE